MLENVTTHTDNLNELLSALSKAQGEIGSAIKSKKNPFFKSIYADLPAVWEACRKPLSSHGLSVMQTTEGTVDQLYMVTMLGHSSGQWIKSKIPLILAKKDPQTMGSSITYSRRYALMSILGICADDEDDDGEKAMVRNGKPTITVDDIQTYIDTYGDKKKEFGEFLSMVMTKRSWGEAQAIEAFKKDPEYTRSSFEAWCKTTLG